MIARQGYEYEHTWHIHDVSRHLRQEGLSAAPVCIRVMLARPIVILTYVTGYDRMHNIFATKYHIKQLDIHIQ